MPYALRKEHILNAALSYSTEVGYRGITRDAVAEIADVSSVLIASYYPRMADLKLAVMHAAIEREIVNVVAQGILLDDPLTKDISDVLKQKVLDYLAKK